MQKSYEYEVATHIGPESCGAARKGSVEALTGERAGRVFSRVRSFLRDADAVRRSGRPLRLHRYREVCQSPARSGTPCTYAGTSRGNREIPGLPKAAGSRTDLQYLRSPRTTPGNRRRKGWREEVWPKGTCHSKPRPGHRAGKTRRVRWSGYVKQQERIRSCGSRRCCTTSTTWKHCAWPTSR
jgi:hypothetical protein